MIQNIQPNHEYSKETISSIGIMAWNIHGLMYEKLETFKNKNDPTVDNLFDENEIVFLSETWKEKFDPDV